MNIKEDLGKLIFKCPHCHEGIIVHVNELNCRVFRHGHFRKTLEQINPHSSKTECEELVKNGLIYGCAGPFRISGPNDSGEYSVEVCDYI
jgi:hypothetical protein